jgi:hypothetical protein
MRTIGEWLFALLVLALYAWAIRLVVGLEP